MPLHPQAELAIRMAGDLPANLTPVELRRAYSEQRVKMLPPAPPIAVVRDLSIAGADGPVAARFYRPEDTDIPCPLLRDVITPKIDQIMQNSQRSLVRTSTERTV